MQPGDGRTPGSHEPRVVARDVYIVPEFWPDTETTYRRMLVEATLLRIMFYYSAR